MLLEDYYSHVQQHGDDSGGRLFQLLSSNAFFLVEVIGLSLKYGLYMQLKVMEISQVFA